MQKNKITKDYDTVLFDLDGTLTDPGVGITNSIMYALNKFGIHVRDRKSLYSFIGPPLTESFSRQFGFSPSKAQQAVEYYREYFADRGIYENILYEGTDKMLAALCNAGKRLITATSKPEIFAVKVLEYFDIKKYFAYVAGADMHGRRSEKTAVIRYAATTCLLSDTSKCVMVGDRENDVNGARANGMDSIGVLYGYGSAEELSSAGADYLAATQADVCGIILGNG